MKHAVPEKEHAYYKKVLKAYGITYGMVAAYLRLSYPYVANILNGKSPLSWNVRAKLDKRVSGLLNPSPLDEALSGVAKGRC